MDDDQSKVDYEIKHEEIEECLNILIEIDERLCQFLKSFSVGSILSTSDLLSLATKYDCEQCQSCFYSSKLFEDHLKTHNDISMNKEEIEIEQKSLIDQDPEQEEQKPLKLKITRTMDQDQDPSLTITSEKKRKYEKTCKICGKKVPDLDNHILFNHSDELKCPHCGKLFEKRVQLRSHLNTHKESIKKRKTAGESGDLIICPICSFCIPRHVSLQRHMMLQHDPIKKCEYCAEEFTTAEELRNHERKHLGEKYPRKLAPCQICGKVLKENSLEYHMKAVHGDAELMKTHICDICGQGFSQDAKLRLHKRKHNKEYKYICAYAGCGKGFYDNRCFKDHIRTHTREPCGSCNVCGKSFMARTAMKDHFKKIHPQN